MEGREGQMSEGPQGAVAETPIIKKKITRGSEQCLAFGSIQILVEHGE